MKPSDTRFRYGFRPVTRADLPLLAGWLAEPHVAQWWDDDPAAALQRIEGHLDSISVEPFIVELNGKPIGYIQSYDPHLEDAHPYQDQPTGTLGIDQFIGPPELIGKGHGPRLIEAFVEQLFDEGAIRAYEKAGFVSFDVRHSDDGPALMLARNADGDFA